jgi:hypothetical protein
MSLTRIKKRTAHILNDEIISRISQYVNEKKVEPQKENEEEAPPQNNNNNNNNNDDNDTISRDKSFLVMGCVLVDFGHIGRGNIFSSGTTMTTSSTVEKKRKNPCRKTWSRERQRRRENEFSR